MFPVGIEQADAGKTRKIPRIKWTDGSTSDPDGVRRLWRQFPEAAVGVVTGQRSNLYVVDVDREEALTAAGFSLTGGRQVATNRPGGRHIYFSAPSDGGKVKNVARDGLDLRGDGGFVVCWGAPPDGTLSPLPRDVTEWARGGTSENGPADVLPDEIHEGGRESALVSLAGSMRRRGSSRSAILAAITVENSERCRPPLPSEDLERIATSVAGYAPEGVPADSAVLIALQARRSNSIAGDYLSKATQPDGDVTQFRLAMEAAEMLQGRACWLDDEKSWWMCSRTNRPGVWSRQRELGVENAVTELVVVRKPDASAAWTAGVEKYLRGRMVVDSAKFDKQPWLLGVTGGVVDLRTGNLLDPDPDLLLTRAAPTRFDESASCTLWLEHLTRLFEDDSERVGWFQRAIGAALVGNAVEKDQVFVVVIGPPGNGKGTAMRTIMHVLGEDQHAVSVNAGDMTGRERHLAWMHRLRGARLAVVEEMKKSALDVQKLKTLTGADTIVANKMRKEDETWVPSHTLFMTSNHPPNFGGDTVGMERRYRPIPTAPSLTRDEMSADYEERLRDEAEGILSWAVQGCLLWQQDGRRLQALESIDRMAEQHIMDDDPFEEWAEECVKLRVGWSSRKAVISSVNWWRSGRGIDHLSRNETTELYNWLRSNGAADKRSSGARERGFCMSVVAGPVIRD